MIGIERNEEGTIVKKGYYLALGDTIKQAETIKAQWKGLKATFTKERAKIRAAMVKLYTTALGTKTRSTTDPGAIMNTHKAHSKDGEASWYIDSYQRELIAIKKEVTRTREEKEIAEGVVSYGEATSSTRLDSIGLRTQLQNAQGAYDTAKKAYDDQKTLVKNTIRTLGTTKEGLDTQEHAIQTLETTLRNISGTRCITSTEQYNDTRHGVIDRRFERTNRTSHKNPCEG